MFMAPISPSNHLSLSLYGGERRLIISIWLPFSELSKVFPMCVERKSRA
jgi:hypothetical protein